MNRVIFNHKSGRQELMELRYAKILQGLKRGTYMTRDTRAEPVVAPVAPEPVVEPDTKTKPAGKKKPQRDGEE